MSRDIKFQYIYGIDGKPETYFNRTFTLSEIQNGCVFDEITDAPFLRGYKIIKTRSFTGIQDKNGKDIYEGDIIDCNSGLCRIYWDDECTCFMLSSDWSDDGWYLNAEPNFNFKYFEVVGNIYENPELLEG